MPQPRHRGEYPPDWKEIAAAVKREAGGKCCRCKHPHAPEVGRTLTVHHFNGDKSNCARWNLMPLCQACHLSVQARVDPEQGLMHDPSPWAIPFIVGMVDAGLTPEPATYERGRWVQRYEAEVGPWPAWISREKAK